MTRPPTRPDPNRQGGSASTWNTRNIHGRRPLRARTVELPPVSALRLVGQRQRGSRACAP